MKLKSLLLAHCLFFYFSSYSQTACDQTFLALKDGGMFEYSETSISQKDFISVLNYYKSNRYEHYEDAKKASLNIGIPLDDVLATLGFSSEEKSYRTFIENIESYYSYYSSHSSSIKTTFKRVNESVVNVIKSCYESLRGVVAFPIYTDDPNVVKIRFLYNNDYQNAPDFATIKVSGVDNVTVINGNKTFKVKDKSEVTIIVKKTPKKFGHITFSSDARSSYGLDFSFSSESQSTTTGILAYMYKDVDGGKQLLNCNEIKYPQEFRNEGYEGTNLSLPYKEGAVYPGYYSGGITFDMQFNKAPGDDAGHYERHIYSKLPGQQGMRYSNVEMPIINDDGDGGRKAYERHGIEYFDENGNKTTGSGFIVVFHSALWSKFLGYGLTYKTCNYDFAIVNSVPRRIKFDNKKQATIIAGKNATTIRFTVAINSVPYIINVDDFNSNTQEVKDKFGVKIDDSGSELKTYIVYIK